MATLQDILSGNFPAAQRYAESYAQMPSYLQDPYLGLSTSQIGNVTKGLLSKTQFDKAQEIASKNAEKLLGLPKGNTAMDRAKAMGYNVNEPMYHGTNKDIKAFDLSKHGTSTDKGDFGKAVYVTTESSTASKYARDKDMYGKDISGANVLPLLVKEGNVYPVNGQQGMNELIKTLGGDDVWYNMYKKPDEYANAVKDLGYDSIRDYGYKQSAIYNPSNVRSQFAAFNPARANEPDLLAATMAFPISGLLQEPKKKKK